MALSRFFRGAARSCLWVAAATTVVVGVPATSAAAVIERVIAVVGDKAILLSDLRRRARPFEQQIEASELPPPSRMSALTQLHRDLAERLVDEELQARAASRSNISVESQEIDDAVARVASQNSLAPEELYEEAQRTGMSRTDYRQEIRRQLLEAKILNLRMQGRVRISEDDMIRAYERLRRDERRSLGYRAAWIRLPIPQGAGSAERVHRLAERVVSQARAGVEFAQLAQRFSADQATRDRGGLLPPTEPGATPPAVAAAVQALEPGDTSEPVKLGGAWAVFRLVEREPSGLPPYEEAKPRLQTSVYAEKMDTAKRHWLQSLRRGVHVDVRL